MSSKWKRIVTVSRCQNVIFVQSMFWWSRMRMLISRSGPTFKRLQEELMIGFNVVWGRFRSRYIFYWSLLGSHFATYTSKTLNSARTFVHKAHWKNQDGLAEGNGSDERKIWTNEVWEMKLRGCLRFAEGVWKVVGGLVISICLL